MFDKAKQFNELRKMRTKALKIRRELAQEKVEVEEKGIRVVASGDQRVESIEIEGQDQRKLTEVVNKAIDQARQKAALKMTQMTGGLGGLLGKL
jgi:DNA-binding protein YbaB